MSRVDRLRGALGRAHVGRRVAERADVQAVTHDEEAVDSLEVAVAENTRLAAALEQQVAVIEASLVPLLKARHPDPDAGGEGDE